jgi:hypothetical protein
MANRFEQVDDAQDDAINLSLSQTAQGRTGRVRIPRALIAASPPEGVDSGEIAALDAFRCAIKLANELRLPVVVLDPDGVWSPEWGELFRWRDDAAIDGAA